MHRAHACTLNKVYGEYLARFVRNKKNICRASGASTLSSARRKRLLQKNKVTANREKEGHRRGGRNGPVPAIYGRISMIL